MLMLQISQRPLTSSRLDGKLFTGRETELRLLEKTAQLGFNTLILGERGAGMTSLMYRYLRRAEDAGRPCYYMDGSQAETPAQTLTLAKSSNTEIETPGGKPVIILDGIDGKSAHRLFGTMRDEAWKTDCYWVVCGQLRYRHEYLAPPADGFYEAEIILKPMNKHDSAALLETRLTTGNVYDEEDTETIRSDFSRIVEDGGGNPGRILAEARASLLRNPKDAKKTEQMRKEAAKLGKSAEGMWRYLLTYGPTSPSDETVAEHFGVSRARVNQVLKLLEKAELVSSYRKKTVRGQPPKMYHTNININLPPPSQK